MMTTTETTSPSLTDQVIANPDQFVVLLSYSEFTQYLLRTHEFFEHESMMGVRSTGVLGYCCGKTVVVFPVA